MPHTKKIICICMLVVPTMIVFLWPTLQLLLTIPPDNELTVSILDETNGENTALTGSGETIIVKDAYDEVVARFPVTPQVLASAKMQAQKGADFLTLPIERPSRTRLVDISIDVTESLSGRLRDRESLIVTNLQKLNKYFRDTGKRFQVGDTILVRVYGSEEGENGIMHASRKKLEIRFSEYAWPIRTYVNQRLGKYQVLLGERQRSCTSKELYLECNDPEEIWKTIEQFYHDQATEGRYNRGSFLLSHLSNISKDNSNAVFNEYRYILLTDGEFQLHPSQEPVRRFSVRYYYDEEKVNLLSFKVEHFERNDKLIHFYRTYLEELGADDLSLCPDAQSHVALIGLYTGDNIRFEQQVKEFYTWLLGPCSIAFYL